MMLVGPDSARDGGGCAFGVISRIDPLDLVEQVSDFLKLLDLEGMVPVMVD